VGHVGNGEVLDHLAVLQAKIAHLIELMRRIAGPVRGSDPGDDA
jgi:hypothetical protein